MDVYVCSSGREAAIRQAAGIVFVRANSVYKGAQELAPVDQVWKVGG